MNNYLYFTLLGRTIIVTTLRLHLEGGLLLPLPLRYRIYIYIYIYIYISYDSIYYLVLNYFIGIS